MRSVRRASGLVPTPHCGLARPGPTARDSSDAVVSVAPPNSAWCILLAALEERPIGGPPQHLPRGWSRNLRAENIRYFQSFGSERSDKTRGQVQSDNWIQQLFYFQALRLAERVGFEPTCPLRDKTLSRRPRYDHFGTSPQRNQWCRTFYSNSLTPSRCVS